MNRKEIYQHVILKGNQLGVFYDIIMIQIASGARISEVLNIEYTDLLEPHFIVLKGLKGSGSRVIPVPECAKYIGDCITNKVHPFQHISRFQVYRFYKRMGFYTTLKGKQNKAVTHSFRRLYINELIKGGHNVKIAKESIGHKSEKSTKHYIDK